jgi:hypothetical protein
MAYTDDFWLLALLFAAVPLLLPFMRRIRLPAPAPAGAKAETEAARPEPVSESV